MVNGGQYIEGTQKLSDKATESMERGLAELKDANPEGSNPEPYRPRGRATHIPAWTPGIEIGADDGELRTVPHVVARDATPPDDLDFLTEFELDPEVWEVVTARKSRWQVYNGDWLEAHRVSVRRRGTSGITAEDLEAVLKPYISKRPPSNVLTSSGQILLVACGDLQIGKSDGSGSAGIVDRFGRITGDVAKRIKAVKGKRVSALILPWLGDCIEGIVSQNGRLAARLDLSVTEQVRVYRRLMLHQIATLAPLADRVLVPVVAGNHDETYRGVRMPVTDSWAIDGASAVADALRMNEQYNHVQFIFPEEGEMNITVDVGTEEHPLVLGFTHGHVMGSSPNAALQWWKGQAHGRQEIGEADILLSAHWHHLRAEFTGGGRTWLQIPALDGGSDWFRHKQGEDVPAGMVTMELTPGELPGWRGLTVLS